MNNMFKNDDKLKILPIPKLHHTINRYKEWIKPLLDDDEYEEFLIVASEFCGVDLKNVNLNNYDKEYGYAKGYNGKFEIDYHNSIGMKLHKMLVDKYFCDNDSWLISLWNDMYLNSRDSIAINLNYYMVMKNNKFKDCLTHTQILALCMVYMANMYFQILDKSLNPDVEKDSPLSMFQYKYVFGGMRIPNNERDKSFVHEDIAQICEMKKHCHIIFYYNSEMYYVEVADEKGNIYNPQVISSALEQIIKEGGQNIDRNLLNDKSNNVKESNKAKELYDIGILTTANRDKASDLYKKILNFDKDNEDNFHRLKTAIAIFCLDNDFVFSDITEEFLCGDFSDKYFNNKYIVNGANRYFDKPTQIILTKNKELGILSEHSHTDGSLYKRIMRGLYDYMYCIGEHILSSMSKCDKNQALDNDKFLLIDDELVNIIKTYIKYDFSSYCKPLYYNKIFWKLDAYINNELKKLYDEFISRKNDIYTRVFVFDEFGKNAIKELNTSPDAFFHMALQMAQYRTFGKFRSTYESVAMRDYKNGRTECNRPTTISAKKFVEDFVKLDNDNGFVRNNDNYAFENKNNDNVYELKRLLINALNEHSDKIKILKSGAGIERHLFGLQQMNKRYVNDASADKFFDSTAYKKLKYDFLATSNFGGEHIKAFGFGPVVEDGYGIGYSVNDNDINITISCKIKNKDMAVELMDKFYMALRDIRKLLLVK